MKMIVDTGTSIGALCGLVLSMLVVECQTEGTEYSTLASTLHLEVFAGYNPLYRPDNQTVVNVTMSFSSLVDVDEKNGHITTTFVPKMSWVDPRLQWDISNTSKYKGIEHLQVRRADVWVPDLEVLNMFQDVSHDVTLLPMVWIHGDGTVFYVPRHTYQTPCSFDLHKFPFDSQHCQIILGSWAYLSNEVDFQLNPKVTEKEFFVGHSDFALSSLEVSRLVTHYGGFKVPFVEIVIDMKLSRRSQYFYVMYLLPADIVLFMLPFVHLLPPNKEGRQTLLGAILIAVVLMLNILSEFMPSYYSDTIPVPLQVYVAAMISVVASLLGSCMTHSLSNTDSKTGRVPRILQKLLRLSDCCRCFKQMNQSEESSYQLLHLERLLQASEESDGNYPEPATDDEMANRQTNSTEGDQEQKAMTKVLQQLVSELQLARYHQQVKAEWIKLAQLVDKLFALAFFISAFCLVRLSH